MLISFVAQLLHLASSGVGQLPAGGVGNTSVDHEFRQEYHCGTIAMPPGTRAQSKITLKNGTKVTQDYDEEAYYETRSHRVYYLCVDSENILVGNNMRECVNGNWLHGVPRCVVNIRNASRLGPIQIQDYKLETFHVAEESATNDSTKQRRVEKTREWPVSVLSIKYDDDLPLDPNGVFEIPLYKQPAHCLRWTLSPLQVWTFSLSRFTIVHYVRIKLYGHRIEDMHPSQIQLDMSLKNIHYLQARNNTPPNAEAKGGGGGEEGLFIKFLLLDRINCTTTHPKRAYEAYQQKLSADFLVCRISQIESLY